MSAKLHVLNVSTLLASIVLAAFSVATLAITAHACKVLFTWFPASDYVWFGAKAARYQHDYYTVNLRYAWPNETYVFASASVSLFAGLLGAASYFAAKQTPRTLWPVLTLSAALLAFLAPLWSFVRTTLVNNALLADPALGCTPAAALVPGNTLTCTREVAACTLLGDMIESRFSEQGAACCGMRAGRWLLVPLFVLGVVMLGAAAVQVFASRRMAGRKSAERTGKGVGVGKEEF